MMPDDKPAATPPEDDPEPVPPKYVEHEPGEDSSARFSRTEDYREDHLLYMLEHLLWEERQAARRATQPPAPAAQRTPEEEAIIDVAARRNGREWTGQHAKLILDQARAVGDLDEHKPSS